MSESKVPIESHCKMSEQVQPTREEQILKAKELYSQGSRNYLVKCYSEAADELSQVCSLYEEIYGELSDELGMPYLLYAKSLIALALDENKVIDVPEEEEDDDDDDDEMGEESNNATDGLQKVVEAVEDESDDKKNEKDDKIETKEPKTVVEETKEADSTDEKSVTVEDKKGKEEEEVKVDSTVEHVEEMNKEKPLKTGEEDVVTSTEDVKANGSSSNGVLRDIDPDKPSTSNGIVDGEEDEDNEATSSLQLAWEILELASKIFTRQGMSGLPFLAEVQTELANIEFENNILEAAREDYEKALKIYNELPEKCRRAMAEIYYKIGLTYLMQQLNQEGAESLKEACALIEEEIADMNSKENRTDKENDNIKDMEETKQEIWAKIAEIEETRQQNIAEVRAALDNVIGPAKEKSADGAGPSSSAASSSAITSSSKPTDITHLIKRKKPDTAPSSEAEAAESPAKRPAI